MMKSFDPSAAHNAFLDDLKATLGRHTDLTPQDMLAVSSQFVGILVALQDQRIMTGQMAMEVVSRNLEVGNATAVAEVMATKGSA